VHLVDHDRAHPREQGRALGIGDQQAERFGRRQQHLRRPDSLPRLAVRGRIAGAGLDANIEAHLGNRVQQIALHVHRQRLQRRDIERVKPVRRPLDQFGQARDESCERLARAGGRDEQSMAACARGRQHIELITARSPALRREPVGKEPGQRLNRDRRPVPCLHDPAAHKARA
jgi:hypothetical protein